MDCSRPSSSVHAILQARTLEWVAISFSNAWKWKGKVKSLSRVRLPATPWTTAAKLLCPQDSPGKNTRVGYHFLLQWIFLIQGLNPHLRNLQADSSPLSHQESPWDTSECINPMMYIFLMHNPTAAKSLQSCLTLCDSIDGSPPSLPHPWDSPGKKPY